MFKGYFSRNPNIYKVLFGFRKGWYLYTPLMLFFSAAFIALNAREKDIFWPLFLFFVANLYGVMAFPAAALIQLLFENGAKFIIAVYISSLLLVEHMTKAAYFEVIDKLNPTETYYELLEEPDFESAWAGLPERVENR